MAQHRVNGSKEQLTMIFDEDAREQHKQAPDQNMI